MIRPVDAEGWMGKSNRMAKITREQLDAYVDDALSETETADVERALRESEPLP